MALRTAYKRNPDDVPEGPLKDLIMDLDFAPGIERLRALHAAREADQKPGEDRRE